MEEVAEVTTTVADPGDLTTRQTRSQHSVIPTRGSLGGSESPTKTPGSISAARLSKFKTSLMRVFREERKDSISTERVKEFINTEHVTEEFSESEFNGAIAKMTEDNQIMIADNFVFLI